LAQRTWGDPAAVKDQLPKATAYRSATGLEPGGGQARGMDVHQQEAQTVDAGADRSGSGAELAGQPWLVQ
jgi:hypothetical protein